MPPAGQRACAHPVEAKIVLVADDNPLIRKMLCQIFEVEEHYNLCEQAENGRHAIELALRCRPDLIILDLSMPVMNGLEAARELKRLMPNIPIILFSQHVVALDKKSTAGSLFERFVSKSEPERLMKYVKELAPLYQS